MKHEKEYSEHATSKHQERIDRDHLRPELEEPNGSTMEEEPQIHHRHHSENMNGKEV